MSVLGKVPQAASFRGYRKDLPSSPGWEGRQLGGGAAAPYPDLTGAGRLVWFHIDVGRQAGSQQASRFGCEM